MTEEEAKKKLCPLLPVRKDHFINCRGSDCMMWKWKTESRMDNGEIAHSTTGDCGLKHKSV